MLLIGLSLAVPTWISILYINKVGRRPLFIIGSLFMGLTLFICGLGALNSWNMTAFLMILAFVVSFSTTHGPICWLYVPEVCVGAATGLAIASQFINLTIIAFAFEFMINSSLQVYGTIWYFSGFNLLGFFFFYFFVKETRGLTDLQKKTLYSPVSAVEVEMNQVK